MGIVGEKVGIFLPLIQNQKAVGKYMTFRISNGPTNLLTGVGARDIYASKKTQMGKIWPDKSWANQGRVSHNQANRTQLSNFLLNPHLTFTQYLGKYFNFLGTYQSIHQLFILSDNPILHISKSGTLEFGHAE